MSTQIVCDYCGVEVPAFSWIGIRIANYTEQHYCTTACLLAALVLPGLSLHTDAGGANPHWRLPENATGLELS